jgi:hypothetical protein
MISILTLNDLWLVIFNVINYDSIIITNAKLKLGCGKKNYESCRNLLFISGSVTFLVIRDWKHHDKTDTCSGRKALLIIMQYFLTIRFQMDGKYAVRSVILRH